MKKKRIQWEYTIIEMENNGIQKCCKDLNILGSLGWEYIGKFMNFANIVVFKRIKQ